MCMTQVDVGKGGAVPEYHLDKAGPLIQSRATGSGHTTTACWWTLPDLAIQYVPQAVATLSNSHTRLLYWGTFGKLIIPKLIKCMPGILI